MKKLIVFIFTYLFLFSLVYAKTVYVTKSGKKYHTENCSSLNKSKIPLELNEAIEKEYTPCKRCNPIELEANQTKIEEEKTDATKKPQKDITVYINKTGKKYHKKGCSSLRKSSISIKLSNARQRGYTPYKRCEPLTYSIVVIGILHSY